MKFHTQSNSLDKDGNGGVSIGELMEGLGLSAEEVQAFWGDFDKDHNEELNTEGRCVCVCV